MQRTNGNGHTQIFSPYLVPLNSNGDGHHPTSLIPDDTEIHSDEPRQICVRHHHPNFQGDSWCGRPLTESSYAFPSLNEAIYILSGNAGVLNQRDGDEVCPSCVKLIREMLTPGPKAYEGEQASPGVFSHKIDQILRPEVSALLRELLTQGDDQTLQTRFRQLRSTFRLSDADEPKAKAELLVIWDALSKTVTEIKQEVRRIRLKEGDSEIGAAQRGAEVAALFVNNIARDTEAVMSELFGLWVVEAGIQTGAAARQLWGGGPMTKEQAIRSLIRHYEDGLRYRLNRGRKGDYPEVDQQWTIICDKIRSWDGKRPSQRAFALELFNSITPNLKGEAKKREANKADNRLRQQLRRCKAAKLCPQKPWKELWEVVRTVTD